MMLQYKLQGQCLITKGSYLKPLKYITKVEMAVKSQHPPVQVATLRPGLLGKHRDEFAYRYCGRRLCPRQGRSQAKRYDNSGVARPLELHGLLNKASPSQDLASRHKPFLCHRLIP